MVSRLSSWTGSVRNGLSQDEPTTITILEEVLDALRQSPEVIGVFFLAGLIDLASSNILGSFALFVASCVVVIRLWPVFGGEVSAESSISRRILVALAALGVVLPIIAVGWLLLLLPGLYFYFRFFLAVPAVMIDEYGPFEALSKSWKSTNGYVFATFGAFAIGFLAIFILFLPLSLISELNSVTHVGATTISGPLAAGIQTYLYSEIS